eukprot:9538429-Alexandrium_andersonii.AAC.1
MSQAGKKSTVPYILHGDGAPLVKKGEQSLYVLNFKGLLAKPGTWITPLMTIVSSCLSKEDGTLDKAFFMIKHLLDSLFFGVHPKDDPWGQPWPEGSMQARLGGQPVCMG